MTNENVSVINYDSEALALELKSSNLTNIHMIGQITDRVFKNGELIEVREGENLVVNSILNLIMSLLKNQSGFSGINYWAVGGGSSSWDSNTPSPNLSETKLTAEIARVPILPSEIVFLDSSFNNSATPTNIIQVKHLFDEGDANGTWREFALFGGNATATLNSGIMINKRHHAVLTKTSDMTVERVMRFTLNLS